MTASPHVLLVEDDVSIGELTNEALILNGFSVTLVTDAGSALSLLGTSNSLDVVLLDLQLGSERGESVFQKLQLAKITYPPVVIFSAQPQSEIEAAGAIIGTPHWLSKPASSAQIVAALHRAIRS